MTSKESFLVTNWINYLDCSGINGSPPPYQMIQDEKEKTRKYGATDSLKQSSTSYIFCVHGNKYGVARCCDDLHGENNDSQSNRSEPIERSYVSDQLYSAGSSGSKQR